MTERINDFEMLLFNEKKLVVKEQVMKFIISCIFTVSLVVTLYADFYVIPVVKKIKNIRTVAKAGGDYTDVQSALDSISDASSINPYLVLIGPGVYAVSSPIQLKRNVTVMGSGEELTIIKGAISSTDRVTSTIIFGANDSALKHLSVLNEGESTYTIAIYNSGDSTIMEHVNATAIGGMYSYGVYNTFLSFPKMSYVTAVGKSATQDNYGIYNKDNANAVMTYVNATGKGTGTHSVGIQNESSFPSMMNVNATGSDGTYSYGVYNSSSNPTIRHSVLKGDLDGIYGGKASLSTIIGGGNSASCTFCVDDNGDELNTMCNITLH